MKTLSIALILVSTPADACHRFSVWKYPTPQRCAVARAQVAQTKMPEVRPEEKIFETDLPRFTIAKSGTIILNLPPGTSDEDGRAAAIELLKQVMGK